MADIDRARRAVLPIADEQRAGTVTYDAKDPDTSFPPIEPLRPPEGRPERAGRAASTTAASAPRSAFGGPMPHPHRRPARRERAAVQPVPHHRPVLADPAALLTGRNHHSVGMGGITEIATSAPGYNSMPPEDDGAAGRDAAAQRLLDRPVRQVPRGAGVGDQPDGAVRPRGRPGRGFEHFYGFIGGETNQYSPALYEGTTPVEPDRTPEEGYHFTEDMTDRAIGWVRQQKALMPGQAVLHVLRARRDPRPAPRADRVVRPVRGQFDDGWDALRERTFARQKELGVIPPDAELTARPDEIPAWDDMPAELAGARPPDGGLRRLPRAHRPPRRPAHRRARRARRPRRHARLLHHRGQRRLAPRAPPTARFNELSCFNGAAALETAEFMAAPHRRLRHARPPTTTTRSAGRTRWTRPYQWTKQVASHWGGTRNGTIVHWPAGISAKGEFRSQFCHVIDVAPTVLEVAGLPEPTSVNGIQQRRYEGTSMAYTFDDPDAAERHTTQYFEMFVQPRHLPQGLDGGDPAQHAVDAGRDAGLRRRRVGAVRRRDDWTQAHDLAARAPGQAAPTSSGCSSSRPPSTTCCRWTTGASSASTPTSPAVRS